MRPDDKFNICWPDIICEFLQITFNQILYISDLLSKDLFIKVKNYNIPLYKCCDIQIAKYINEVIKSIRIVLEENSLDSIIFNIYGFLLGNQNKIHLQSFILEFGDCTKDRLDYSMINEESEINEFYSILETLEQQFRDFLLVLLVSQQDTYPDLAINQIYSSTPLSAKPSTSRMPQNSILNMSDICEPNLKTFDVHLKIIDSNVKSINQRAKKSKNKYYDQSLFSKLQSHIEFPWILANDGNNFNLASTSNAFKNNSFNENNYDNDYKIVDTKFVPLKHIDTPFVNIQAYTMQNLYTYSEI